ARRGPALQQSLLNIRPFSFFRQSDFVIRHWLVLAGTIIACSTAFSAAPVSATDYFAIDAIFAKHCLDCHGSQDPEGKLVLESFETLLKGGESGSVINPGKSSDSLLVKMIEGRFEKDGKKKIMPPGKRKKPELEEIALIKAWIDAGAKGPADGS